MMKYMLFGILLFVGNGVKAQITAGVPDPIVLCDVNNPGDEVEVFDMTIREEQIINGQSNVVVTYHPTSGDALSGTNAYPNPEAHINESNPQIVFVRLQSTAGQGWDVTTLELIVPLIPFVDQVPDAIFINEGDGDGSAIFDLTINESQALGSQDPFTFQFKYYTSLQDATNDVDRIATPEMFQNTANPQTIFARMAPLQDICDFEVYNFEIETDGILGISEYDVTEVRLFPNPASERVTIQTSVFSSETTITLYNLQGKQVFSETFVPQNDTISIDVSTQVAGIYFIRVSSEGNSIIKRLIKN